VNGARRVAVTGIGAVTPIGSGADGLWQGVLANRSAVRTIDRFDASPFPSRIAAQVEGFDPADHLDPRRARRLDRFSQLSVASARMAATHAGWTEGGASDGRTGVWIGSALGGVAFGEEQHAGYVARGMRGVAPTLATAVFGGAGASNIAIDLGIHGPAVGNANSCASGAVAIGQAFHAIRSGIVDAALAGGAEAPLAPLTFGAFAMIRVLSSRNDDPASASRPFDVDRDGFVMGEGAAVLALEAWERAVGRDAFILAELVGFGASTDAYHLTAPLPSGRVAAAAIAAALADGGVAPAEIGYVNAHASSTPLNEAAEARALHHALGGHAAVGPE
jgi:3-oxoacyl-[acyl-carrier-protein] synthase II